MSKSEVETWEYDDQGRLVRRTLTVVDAPAPAQSPTYTYPTKPNYPHYPYIVSTWSSGGITKAEGHTLYNKQFPEDPDSGVPAAV